MKEIQILKRNGELNNELGDFLFGEPYINLLEQKDLEENEVLLLIFLAYFSPNALAKLGCFNEISLSQFLRAGSYECPFNSNRQCFFGLYPLAILSKDISKYRLGDLRGGHYDIAWDVEWTKTMSCAGYDKDKNKIVKIDIDNIATAYLGHGYTEGTLPYDGSGKVKQVKVRLSNGDWLVCATWEWYNK